MFDPPPADDDNQPGSDDLGSENSQGSIGDGTAMASINNDVAAKKRDRSQFHDSSDDEEAMAAAGNLPQAVDTAPKRAPAAPAKAAPAQKKRKTGIADAHASKPLTQDSSDESSDEPSDESSNESSDESSDDEDAVASGKPCPAVAAASTKKAVAAPAKAAPAQKPRKPAARKPQTTTLYNDSSDDENAVATVNKPHQAVGAGTKRAPDATAPSLQKKVSPSAALVPSFEESELASEAKWEIMGPEEAALITQSNVQGVQHSVVKAFLLADGQNYQWFEGAINRNSKAKAHFWVIYDDGEIKQNYPSIKGSDYGSLWHFARKQVRTAYTPPMHPMRVGV